MACRKGAIDIRAKVHLIQSVMYVQHVILRTVAGAYELRIMGNKKGRAGLWISAQPWYIVEISIVKLTTGEIQFSEAVNSQSEKGFSNSSCYLPTL